MASEIIFKAIPADSLVLDGLEAAARLKVRLGYSHELIEECKKRLIGVIDCRFCAVRTEIRYPAENMVDIGFGEFKSRSLYKNLDGSGQAFIFAVTLGLGVDRLLLKLSCVSSAEYFITDALASAYTESACDEAQRLITGGAECRRRFSPGYGDLSLELQPKILNMLSAGKLLNITLSKSLLMTPKKSVTAIIGLT